MNANDIRELIAKTYREIIGRNKYSQSLRDYCFTKYKDGKYYSDCSSSVCHTYKKAGYGFGILNTVGMYNSAKLTVVPVKIVKGIIQNPEVLRLADMLLFAGNDPSRKSAGYVGHVEMVGEISGKTVYLYGHGSGTPRKTEMNAYCKKRYGTKSVTALGHRGLIKVVRFIQDDEDAPADPSAKKVKVNAGTWNLRKGPGKEHDVICVVNGGTILDVTAEGGGWYFVCTGNLSGWISPKGVKEV